MAEPISIFVDGVPWRPPGQWRQFPGGIAFQVAGIHHYRESAIAFAQGADACAQAGAPFGLYVEREPENAEDHLALKVFGVWHVEGRQVAAHVGYVPRDIAATVPASCPVAADLVFALAEPRHDSKGTWVDVEMHLLLPGLKSGFWEGRPSPWRSQPQQGGQQPLPVVGPPPLPPPIIPSSAAAPPAQLVERLAPRSGWNTAWIIAAGLWTGWWVLDMLWISMKSADLSTRASGFQYAALKAVSSNRMLEWTLSWLAGCVALALPLYVTWPRKVMVDPSMPAPPHLANQARLAAWAIARVTLALTVGMFTIYGLAGAYGHRDLAALFFGAFILTPLIGFTLAMVRAFGD